MGIPCLPMVADRIQVKQMSGEDLRRAVTGEPTGSAPDEFLTPLVGDEPLDGSPSAEPLTDVLASVFDDEMFDDEPSVAASLITESLDEILLAMIASTTEETHGTGLMDELERQFNTELSPGTVYPRLHDLESEGILQVHELVHTKQYSISDAPEARSLVQRAVAQHLAVASFLQASLDAA